MAHPAYISLKDSFRAAIESATGGLCTVLYDDVRLPSIMRVIPKFKIDDIHGELGSGVHPAFIVNGVEKAEIFVGQYPAYVYGNRAYSMPRMDPANSIDYDTAVSRCAAKGAGWHLMTAWEWAAVALWCLKHGFQPRGNNSYGRAYDALYETGTRVDGGAPGSTSGTPRTLTGTGPHSWNHDNSPAGIADLVGNIWEWNLGVKLIRGRIYITPDNHYSLAEASWAALDAYFDSPVAGNGEGSGSLGDPILADPVTNYGHPDPDSSADKQYNVLNPWRTMTNNLSTTPVSLRQLLIAPTASITGSAIGAIYVRNYGERLPFRGGSWNNASYSGLCALHLNARRSHASSVIGFRPAYIA